MGGGRPTGYSYYSKTHLAIHFLSHTLLRHIFDLFVLIIFTDLCEYPRLSLMSVSVIAAGTRRYIGKRYRIEYIIIILAKLNITSSYLCVSPTTVYFNIKHISNTILSILNVSSKLYLSYYKI